MIPKVLTQISRKNENFRKIFQNCIQYEKILFLGDYYDYLFFNMK